LKKVVVIGFLSLWPYAYEKGRAPEEGVAAIIPVFPGLP
jgi:hypothetical protein